MKIAKTGFTLLEIIIASSILTIAVFGVYKLIGENTKVIQKSSNQSKIEIVMKAFEECVTQKEPSGDFYMTFGNNYEECNTSSAENTILIDNIEYTMTGSKIQDTDNYISWRLSISSDLENIKEKEFIKLK